MHDNFVYMRDPESRTDEWLTSEDAFSRAIGCLRSHAPVSLAEWPYLSLSDLRKSCTAVHCMMPSFCICIPGKEVGRDNHATIRAQERNALQIFKKNLPCKNRSCTYFGNRPNHGRDTESRQLPKITAEGENHGNHDDREFVINTHRYS